MSPERVQTLIGVTIKLLPKTGYARHVEEEVAL